MINEQRKRRPHPTQNEVVQRVLRVQNARYFRLIRESESMIESWPMRIDLSHNPGAHGIKSERARLQKQDTYNNRLLKFFATPWKTKGYIKCWNLNYINNIQGKMSKRYKGKVSWRCQEAKNTIAYKNMIYVTKPEYPTIVFVRQYEYSLRCLRNFSKFIHYRAIEAKKRRIEYIRLMKKTKARALDDSKSNNKVYFSVKTNRNKNMGRIVIELFYEEAPIATENFRALCTGEEGFGYKGSKFNRGISGYYVLGGVASAKSCPKSIYGKQFKDDGFTIKHDRPGIVTMSNCGSPDTNDSEFMICLKAIPALDGKNVAFGCVIEGLDIVEEMSRNMEHRPFIITKCGQFTPEGEEQEEETKEEEKEEEQRKKDKDDEIDEAVLKRYNKLRSKGNKMTLSSRTSPTQPPQTQIKTQEKPSNKSLNSGRKVTFNNDGFS